MQAVVHFRTQPAGAYKWLKRGQSRGWWRVLLVEDAAKSTSVSSANVVDQVYAGRPGIRGVTPRSAYYVGGYREVAQGVADAVNGLLMSGLPVTAEQAREAARKVVLANSPRGLD